MSIRFDYGGKKKNNFTRSDNVLMCVIMFKLFLLFEFNIILSKVIAIDRSYVVKVY